MFRVMLCGAADTASVAREFADAVRAAGGDPWHYLEGQILYLNDATASFRRNSAQTVASSDVAAFVIVRNYGHIAWDTELRAALDDGKPVIVMCLAETYSAYVEGSPAIDPRLRDVLTELEVDRSITVVPFAADAFGVQFARHLARLFQVALGTLQVRNRRQALAVLLGDPQRLAPHDLAVARDVAVDEFEDKRLRKRAVQALADTVGADVETLVDLVRSDEQGVSRLTLSLVDRLHRTRPPEPSLLEELVEVCNGSDDVGLARRLVTQLFALSPASAVAALQGLDVTEIGLRRRIAAGVEQNVDGLRSDPVLVEATVELLLKCIGKATEAPWLARARALLADLRPGPSS